jgi:DNA-directed RNA polymerase subunit RPC12/RpoP
MADSSDSESLSSTPEESTRETATDEPQPQPQPRGDSKGETGEDDDGDSSSSRNSSSSDNPPSPPANRLNSLETQQQERVEAVRQADAKSRQAAKDLVAEANRQQAAKDRLEEAKRLEEEEAQARRREFVEPAAPTTGYACGDCNATLFLGLGVPVRCCVCGCRILFKKRTNRLV